LVEFVDDGWGEAMLAQRISLTQLGKWGLSDEIAIQSGSRF